MFTRILLPVDISDPDDAARSTAVAVGLAQHHGAALEVIYVLPSMGMSIVGAAFNEGFERDAMAEAERQLGQWVADTVPAAIPARHHVAHGSIYDEVLRAASTLACDLIVIGAHRPALRDYLLGPNAARVVRHANQSVMVVRD